MPFILLCLLLQASASTTSISSYALIVSAVGLLVTGGAAKFFISYGTRLAMVEKESAENKAKIEKNATELTAKLEKHANELTTANTQVALVAAALESIKTALADLKQDVKEWMKSHGTNHTSE